MTARARRGPPRVIKFGGASLEHPAGIASAIRAAAGPTVVVASAREGVTDRLESAIRHPRASRLHADAVSAIAERHPGLPPAGARHVERLGRLFGLLERARGVDLPLADRIRSQGERIAVHWLSARLQESGVPAVPVEADHLGLITDNAYGASCLRLDRSRSAVRRGLGRLLARGDVPVVTGYFGRSLEGRVATLGRGGSDYTAAGIGAILDAGQVDLVKRHVAVYSADPREVPAARPIPALSYEEAEELAQFGARVLHPLTIEPARAAGVTLTVRSFEDPTIATTIGPARARRRNRAMTSLTPLRLLRLRVPGGRQRPGIVAEVAQRLATAGVNVVQLFTSSALLSIVLDPPGVLPALRSLAPITQDDAVDVEGPFRVALVTVIGDGVLADVDRLPAEAVRGAEGFSATPRALSLAVPERQATRVLRALHRALVEEVAS